MVSERKHSCILLYNAQTLGRIMPTTYILDVDLASRIFLNVWGGWCMGYRFFKVLVLS